MKKISYVFSLIMVFVLSLCTFLITSSKETYASSVSTSASLDKFIGYYSGPFYVPNSKHHYSMMLEIYKVSEEYYLAYLETYNLSPKTLRGCYSLGISYDTSSKQYYLEGDSISNLNSSVPTIKLYGTLSGNTFNGYMISNNDNTIRFNFNLRKTTVNQSKINIGDAKSGEAFFKIFMDFIGKDFSGKNMVLSVDSRIKNNETFNRLIDNYSKNIKFNLFCDTSEALADSGVVDKVFANKDEVGDVYVGLKIISLFSNKIEMEVFSDMNQDGSGNYILEEINGSYKLIFFIPTLII